MKETATVKPTIYFVSDTDRGKRHRAFSRTRPSFCGVVSIYSGWARVRSSVSNRERKCKECVESPLNGEVNLIENHYVPAGTREGDGER